MEGSVQGRLDGPLVFRHPPLSVLVAVAFSVCALPFAAGAPWFALVYLLPLGAVGWVLRVRTTVDTATLRVRGVLRTRRVAWDDVTAMRLRSSRTRSGISAVLRDGSELPLPALRTRDLSLLAHLSGGRLPDPAAATGTEPDATTTHSSTTDSGTTDSSTTDSGTTEATTSTDAAATADSATVEE